MDTIKYGKNYLFFGKNNLKGKEKWKKEMQCQLFILFLLLHLMDMKLLSQIALIVAKHLHWLVVPTLLYTADKV